MPKTMERLKVQAYTPTHIFTGYVRILPEQRLIDILNGALRGTLRTNKEFLPVSEVEMCSLDGTRVTLQSVYINKANILFARETEDSQTWQLGGKVGHKLYPFVSKSPVPVRLYIPSYTLTGEMHCAKGQSVWNALNSGMRFLPLTNVEIFPSAGSSESGVSFVGVNKGRIVSLEELEFR